MEAKVKEELPDKDYQSTAAERRKTSTAGKERRSPEQEESRSSPTPGPPSPQNNGTTGSTALSSTESLSPPPERAPALQRLRRFLSALLQFAGDASADAGERVRTLVHNLASGTVTIEEFQAGVQECTNYPLRASVPGFLRALLPVAQRDLHARARRAKQTPLQYIRAHEHLILESSGDSGDIFSQPDGAVKRRASDPFYEQTNGSHDDYPPHAKRPPPSSLFLNPPFLYPLPSNASLFDYGHPYQYHGTQGEAGFERKDGGISVRDVSSMNASFSERLPNPSLLKTDDEWKNINTMLNCILSMVEKTKRALAILQQRGQPGVEPAESSDIKRAASEIMAAAVRQTEERVAEVRRRAEDAVNQVKRQALVELQRAVGAAEARALELAAAERKERRSPPPPASPPQQQTQCCWNCGRKAQETCSGCNAARYCGAFCQHKDWESHHQVCSGRDQKPTALRTSPPATQPTLPNLPTLPSLPSLPNLPSLPKPLTRATTPIAPPTTDNRLSLSNLNSAERLHSNQDRSLTSTSTDRIALATLSTGQGLVSGIGNK